MTTQQQIDAAEARQRLDAFRSDLRGAIDKHVDKAGGRDRLYARYLAKSAVAEELAHVLVQLAREEALEGGDSTHAQEFAAGVVAYLEHELLHRRAH